MVIKLFALVFFLSTTELIYSQTKESIDDENSHTFSGRISSLNEVAKLARIRTDFGNIKFFNRRDRVDFWNESYPMQKCVSWVEGRANDYLLLKIPDYENCIRRVHFTTGSLLSFSSTDLKKSIQVVKELVEILLKKRLAMKAKMQRHQVDLENYIEKISTVNSRYEVLRQKLENEWNKELTSIEEDKARSFTEFKTSEARLFEIDTKLEAYKVDDHNIKIDRWSLDPELYLKK